jgi:GNAT superfamily N-acetyltransferase
MDIVLKEITSKQELRSFIRFPHLLERDNGAWVPALDMDEMNTLHWDINPAFEHCQARYYLAYQDGKAVGRVAAIYNPLHYQTWDQNYLRFGWIDFIEDPDVSKALMKKVESWAKELGCTAVHGPLGFTDLDREGMLVEGFDELGTLATRHDQPYYHVHLENMGYEKDADWLEHEVDVSKPLEERVSKVAAIARKRYKLHIPEIKKKNDLLPYAPELFEIINDAYSHLYGVVHLSDAQVEAYVKQYFGFVIPELVPFVLDENGRMVGFTIAMPSLSRALQKGKGRLFPFGFIHLLKALNRFDRVDMYLGAVRPEYQGKGINAMMMEKFYLAVQKMGVKKLHANPQMESNYKVLQQWEYFDVRQHKRRRVYIKHF